MSDAPSMLIKIQYASLDVQGASPKSGQIEQFI